jgi:tRNA(Ile2) C34 agmatinyltransferase TiaS
MPATLTLDLFRPSILDPVDEDADPRGHGDRVHRASEQGGGLTLDDLVVEVWEGLSAHRTVACPACGEAMTPRYGAGPAPVGGRCRSCGTTLE